ncbi:Peptidyl-tRNA hydrolase [uncultured archaeon]|nr:Peptidyl-tRNA hydrolase [uncultured archaeon]
MVSTSDPDEIKQVILLRMDLNMGKGKMVAQGAHASIDAYLDAVSKTPAAARKWHENGMPKVALKVESERDLVKMFMAAKDYELPCSLIVDAGRTQLEPGSKTAVGIGPAAAELLDRFTGQLKLL